MTGWGEYAAAWALFLLTHAVPVRPPVKPWLVARLGRGGYLAAYSALSLLALGWLILAAGRAPWVPLWPAPPAAAWIVLAAMTGAALILAFGLGRPNPLSFGGRRDSSFDPDRPGILRVIRHPVLAAVGIWALAHLVANGDLAHVLLFGGFALFAGLGMAMIDRRNRRAMGADAWAGTLARMRRAPPGPWRGALARATFALAGVAGVVLIHPWIAGRDVLALLLP